MISQMSLIAPITSQADCCFTGKSGWVGVSAICPPGTLVNYTYRSYVTNFIVQETIDNYKYMQLHDYLLGAMSLVDSVMDIQFPRKIIFGWEQILTFRKTFHSG